MKESGKAFALGFVLCAVTMAVASQAQVQFSTIFSFDGTDGIGPTSPLIQGTDGGFYGTSYLGGLYGQGAIFKIGADGAETVLYNFCPEQPPNCPDGSNPAAGLVQATDGNFYGTTSVGGANDNDLYPQGPGTVFKMSPEGTLTTLYSFCALTNCADGAESTGALIQGSDGNFYGTTFAGGATDFGTVFKITPTGTLTSLYSFINNNMDGLGPASALVQGFDGNFYGTTVNGGTHQSGTAFKITPSGVETVLYDFCGRKTCGSHPVGTLLLGPDGNFYGTTQYGGARLRGTVFGMAPNGHMRLIYSFCPDPDQICHGQSPDEGLTYSSNGYLVGATGYNAAIFGISPTGKFEQYTNLTTTNAAPVQGTNGLFYGTAGGGAFEQGIVFSINAGLPPFITTTPVFGPAATPVIILGTNLTGATSVTFNGTSAQFTVVSASEITSSVPAGATSGRVKVTTPNGTLTSNMPFTVTQ